MIQQLYNDSKIKAMLERHDFKSIIGEGVNPLDWLKEIYISNYQYERKDNDNTWLYYYFENDDVFWISSHLIT